MNSMRILGAVCAGILASSLGTLAACGGSPDAKEAATTAQAVSAASVSIALFDANGVRVGDGSGVMIAPRLVLTSGHLISGKGKWVVTSADGKQKVTGSRGMTYDWMKYDSNKAHPRRHDVGVIHLDDAIKLSAYPKLVGSTTVDGTKATRMHGTGTSFQELDVVLGKVRSAPNSWLTESKPGTLDTGGAVYDSRGILGIVSGRGTTTGKLYVARIDRLIQWLGPKVACAGGAMVTRTYADPAVDKTKEICEDAGTPGSSGNGGNGNPGNNGGPGGNGGSDGSGGSCEGNNDGYCSGLCSPGSGPSWPGGDGTPGSGGNDGSNPGGGTPGSSWPGGDGTPGSDGSTPGIPGSGGSDGSNPGGGTPGSSWPGSDATPGTPGVPGTGSGSGSPYGTKPGSGSGDGFEVCQGPNDNPDVCPPEPQGCTGSDCGGGQPDDSMDYGNCGCGSSSEDGEIYLH